MKKIAVILIVISMIFSVRCAYASITIYADMANSESGLGDFVAELTYDDDLKELTLEIENTSPTLNGGYLLGFSFNNPYNRIIGVQKGASWTDSDFSIIGGTTSFINGIDESPYGAFDIGAEVQGNPSGGIGVGVTETFVFDLITNDPLSENNFIEALSFQQVAQKEGDFFLARFQGFENAGSDKVPGLTRENPVPEPMTMLLFGPALLGLVGFKRRKA